jgi:hypothetical protein
MAVPKDQKPATTDAEMAEKVTSSTESGSSLPPLDGGLQAWLFLAGCYMIELLVFGTSRVLLLLSAQMLIPPPIGFGFSFGVFQDYYSTHGPFTGTGNVAIIGTLTTVRSYRPFTSTLFNKQANRYPSSSRSWAHPSSSHSAASILAGHAGSPLPDCSYASSPSF